MFKRESAFTVKIYGRVQGVGFRWHAQKKAVELNIAGYARNLPDATVEVGCAGCRSAMDQFLRWLAKGPPLAVVEKTEKKRASFDQFGETFKITG